MKIDYQETSKDLQTRIDIHARYGARDIDAWMLELLKPTPGSKILDVKQCRAFYEYLQGQAEIVGGDISAELLSQARRLSENLGGAFDVRELDFNRPFPFEADRFDLVSCCFALYYAENIPFTVGEMHRVLRPGGRLFTTGPMPENKRLFYDVIREATGKPIPPMPGSSRYGSEILETIRRQFAEVEVHVFENPLTFEDLQPFLEYTRASLSEDRKLWKGLFTGPEDFEGVMQAIANVAGRRLRQEGRLVMTKVVGGFVATK